MAPWNGPNEAMESVHQRHSVHVLVDERVETQQLQLDLMRGLAACSTGSISAM